MTGADDRVTASAVVCAATGSEFASNNTGGRTAGSFYKISSIHGQFDILTNSFIAQL